MELYNDFWISGHAIPAYPGGGGPAPGACVSYKRPDGSAVDLSTVDLPNFAFEDQGVAELIGLDRLEEKTQTAALPAHDNIRGGRYYH